MYCADVVAQVVYSILAEVSHISDRRGSGDDVTDHSHSQVPHEISFYWRSRAKTDALQAAMTFLLTLLFSVEVGFGSYSSLANGFADSHLLRSDW